VSHVYKLNGDKKMKKRFCSSVSCGNRRIHYEGDTLRGTPTVVKVPDDFEKDKKVYCSIECFNYDKVESKQND